MDVKTCNRCQKRTEIPYLWDCSVCRNLNKDFRCMSCGEPVVVPFRYCSERCMADATDWGVWHPIVDSQVLTDKSFQTKEYALEFPDADDAVKHGDLVIERARKKKDGNVSSDF